MPKLIYIPNTSLDGYIEDAAGAFDWGNPDQIHEFITDLVRPMERIFTAGEFTRRWLTGMRR